MVIEVSNKAMESEMKLSRDSLKISENLDQIPERIDSAFELFSRKCMQASIDAYGFDEFFRKMFE